jgi:hypothetical protein
MKTAVEILEEQLYEWLDGRIYLPPSFFEQAKEMEKKQMVTFAEFVATYPDKNKNANGDILHARSKYDGAERTVDLLEEFLCNQCGTYFPLKSE